MNPEIFTLVDSELKRAGFRLASTSVCGESYYYRRKDSWQAIRVSTHQHRGHDQDVAAHVVFQNWCDPDTVVSWTRDAISTFSEGKLT